MQDIPESETASDTEFRLEQIRQAGTLSQHSDGQTERFAPRPQSRRYRALFGLRVVALDLLFGVSRGERGEHVDVPIL